MTASATMSVSPDGAWSGACATSSGSAAGAASLVGRSFGRQATAFLAVLLRGVLTTSPSLGGVSSAALLGCALGCGLLRRSSRVGLAISASVEPSLTGSGDPECGRSIVGCIRGRGRRPGWPACRPPPTRGGLSWRSLRSSLVLMCRARWDRASNSSMARTRTFSFRCTGARPGCGSLRNRCGESEPPAVKRRLRHTRSLLVAVEDQVHLLARRVTPRMYAIEARTHFVSKPSPVSHTSQLVCASCRAAGIYVTGLTDGSGFAVEPALGEPGQDRRLHGSKTRGLPPAGLPARHRVGPAVFHEPGSWLTDRPLTSS